MLFVGDIDQQIDAVKLEAGTLPGRSSVGDLPQSGEISLQHFTQTLGGGYFFLPGIAALKFIVGDRAGAKLALTHRVEAVVS